MTKTFTIHRLDRLLRNLLNEINNSDDPSFQEEQRDLLERRFATLQEFCEDHSSDWKPSAGEIHKLLAARNQIAVIWDIEDVQILRPDLSDDQAWQVLEVIERSHDSGIGINWHVIEAEAEQLFPEPAQEEPVNNPSTKGIDQ